MNIVSNASTLILLARSTLLQIWLEHVQIIIPIEVHDETILGKETYDARLIKKLVDEKSILVQSAPKAKIESVMKDFRLDIGEAAAYALFDNKKHTAIMTDDAELIKLCKLEGIDFVGAMGIVVALYNKHILNKVEALEKLDKLHEIGRYSQEIYSYFRNLIEGGQNGNSSGKA